MVSLSRTIARLPLWLPIALFISSSTTFGVAKPTRSNFRLGRREGLPEMVSHPGDSTTANDSVGRIQPVMMYRDVDDPAHADPSSPTSAKHHSDSDADADANVHPFQLENPNPTKNANANFKRIATPILRRRSDHLATRTLPQSAIQPRRLLKQFDIRNPSSNLRQIYTKDDKGNWVPTGVQRARRQEPSSVRWDRAAADGADGYCAAADGAIAIANPADDDDDETNQSGAVNVVQVNQG